MNARNLLTGIPARRGRARLWRGVSLATLVVAVGADAARAQTVGALMAVTHQATVLTTATTPGVGSSAIGASAAMAAASARALRYQTQLNSAQNLAQAAQAAAQAAARALDQNMLAGITNGITSGCAPGVTACGLTPAVTVVTPAASDPTGVATWQGAALPTQTATTTTTNGKTTTTYAVNITQTDQRAILSWTTFNIGQNTTLTFDQKPGWVALNRVVGGIDPLTGIRNPGLAPSEILGNLKANGTVLVLDQNGVIFGGSSQVNVASLMATTLEIGRAADVSIAGVATPVTLAERNTDFLEYGILGYGEQTPVAADGTTINATFSAQESPTGATSPNLASAAIQVDAGASLTAADGGALLLMAPVVVNAGALSAADGEVALQGGASTLLTASAGGTGAADPDVRGLVVASLTGGGLAGQNGSVTNAGDAIIDAPRSYISLGGATVADYGLILSTTSIAENGYVNLFGSNITVAQDPGDAKAAAPVIAIGPDDSTATLPQDTASLSSFAPSRVRIGNYTFNFSAGVTQTSLATTPSNILIGSGSLVYAPGGNVSVGTGPAPATGFLQADTSLVIQDGATLDAAGLTDVIVPASRNAIEINPVLGNELADSPAFRTGFLDGATVYLDPRLSGVTAAGVAWTGSPLIAATAYAQQVGETVSELMVKGGSISLGVQPTPTGSTAAQAPTFQVQAGALIDISGGWKTYQAGLVQQSYLVDTSGEVIPISQANPDTVYVAVYDGYAASQPRWGVTQSYGDPLLTGAKYEGQYTEGQDGGALTLVGSVVGFDGQLAAGAFAGPQQILAATVGSAANSLPGDQRHLQAAPSQLPAGGYVDVNQSAGGGDIDIQGASYVVGGYAPGVSTATTLDATALSSAGLSQLTVQTTGKVDVSADAAITLDPGGVFVAIADRTISVEGQITAASGTIDLTTIGRAAGLVGAGSVLASEPNQVGAYDIVVDGTLDVAGRWANDFNVAAGDVVGAAYLNGGKIALTSAANMTLPTADISGSLLIDAGARLDLSGGGYVTPTGGLVLTATGGNLSLIDATSPGSDPTSVFALQYLGTTYGLSYGQVSSRVSIADGAILDAGFGGGGAFSLTTPYFSFTAAGGSSVVGADCGICGSVLPLDFFSKTGFASYAIVSDGTRFLQNVFASGGSLYSAVLETQIAEVGAGQTLNLSQSYFSPVLSVPQIAALQGLGTGGSLYSVLTPSAPTDAWDQKAVSLSLGGLIELKVDAGGQVTGAPGAALTASELHNLGTIRLPGGTITQSETSFNVTTSIGVSQLSDAFGAAVGGYYVEGATNTAGATDGQPDQRILTNAETAANAFLNSPIYFLGDLPKDVAVDLAPGSVTDLSGAAIVNPRAAPSGNLTAPNFVDGKVLAGGAFIADGAPTGAPKGFVAEAGAVLDLAGAVATFDRPTLPDAPPAATAPDAVVASYAPTPVWSNGGNLSLLEGGQFAGASVDAAGGAPLALGGVLTVSSPILYADGTPAPAFVASAKNTPLAAGDVTGAGFSSLVALGSLTSQGDVSLSLPRSLFVEGGVLTIGSGGDLAISAPYIGLLATSQTVGTPAVGAIGTNSITLSADAIDVTGAVLFDQSVASVTLAATGDIRLIGVEPSAQSQAASSLVGQMAANGDITFAAAQVYPTTGTTFTVSTTGVSSPGASQGGLVAFDAVGATPATPYSAGGALTVLAANIDQAGVVRAPLGALTLGSATASTYAPATASVTLAPGSVTSVSADGLDIPYGTTTDQIEWYFTPTQSSALTAPPAGVLTLVGQSVTTASGATVDLKGGGDVYAYEFVPGTGGSRDVLDQYNPDQFSSNNGYQYPDGRQIYAIVPGLSSATAAAIDPVYSAGYSALYGASQVGERVYLNAAPGLAAGWYTLLPAKYALLPGGMRVVQDTGAATPPVTSQGGSTGTVLADGTIVTAGYFGVAGVDTRSATPVVFDVQSQSTILKESNIALTQGDTYFTNLATRGGVTVPQLPIDSGRLILAAQTGLTLDATFETTPADQAASGGAAALTGRGSEVDISAANLFIADATSTATAPAGAITLTDTSLEALDAASLFLGGTRTDNASGTTSLTVSAGAITVADGVTLKAPEVLLATDGPASTITIDNGAAIVATGAVTGESSGDYVITGLVADPNNPGSFLRAEAAEGGFLRVSNGPQRLLDRTNPLKARPGRITVGSALLPGVAPTLQGQSIELDTPGRLNIDSATQLDATSIALSAGHITLGATNPGGGLLLTPQLLALLSKTANVTLRSANAIRFDDGDYTFEALTLDTPGLRVMSGAVSVTASGAVTISDSSKAKKACDLSGQYACGVGSLAITGQTIAFGSGLIRTYGAGAAVTLSASGGVFADGAATLDAGPAALTIDAPFVGDRGTGVADATQPSLTLTTTGAVAIDSATAASAYTAPAGTPGADLTIAGASVSIVGTELRATAGTLDIQSASGIAISGGALLATPGYAKAFGDAADPSSAVSAPGGLLTLTAATGDISIEAGSSLAVGGTAGQAGTLSLTAEHGQVYAWQASGASPPVVVALATTLSGVGGGASLNLDTGGAFDLATFVTDVGSQFTGAITVRAGQGDLTLDAGQTLTATKVSLTADAGQIADSGTIDTSGVNGGDVALYGQAGVTLASTAVIDARASGYGATSTLQASGGAVTLGVDFTGTTTTDPVTGRISGATSGAITLDAGAVIDVSAADTQNRLVPMSRTNGTYYTYVAGDVGGTVTFRAPVIDGGVNVSANGKIAGASGVVLDAFERFSLDAMAANPNYVGVTAGAGGVTLDLSQTGAGLINPLADSAGPIVSFVQGFAGLVTVPAGLSGLSHFSARPGVELDAAGNITLASNWNLGAGTVNVAGAVAAGLMAADPGLPGQYYVVGADAQTLAANEGLILADYATALYRVGGSFYGQAGMLSLRAGGALTLNGSLTDGFFQFADQTNPEYLNQVIGGGGREYQASVNPVVTGNTVEIRLPGDFTTGTANGPALAQFLPPAAPYSAAANSAAALGDTPDATGALVSGTGDPLGSAQVFPLLPGGGGATVGSWSYQLVGGAAPSVNPLAVATGTNANVTVQGEHVYGYQAAGGPGAFSDSLNLIAGSGSALTSVVASQWLQDELAANPALSDSSTTTINFNAAPLAARGTLNALAATYFAADSTAPYTIKNGKVTATLADAAGFMVYLSNNFSAVAGDYKAPSAVGGGDTLYATAPTLVRTGTGSISLAASGAIDLSDGYQPPANATPMQLKSAGGAQQLNAQGELIPVSGKATQLGGAAVYTSGALADLGLVTATDVASGTSYTVDLAASETRSDNLAGATYAYGKGGSGFAGVLIANPAYLQGGGDITLSAGTDVLGRRDTARESQLEGFGGSTILPSWAGSGDQPWRTGVVGSVVNMLIDPQLFAEGVGALGGGSIAIQAGGAVSDLSVVSTGAATTGDVAGGQGQALAQLGGGDVTIAAANMLGGRLDLVSGDASVKLTQSLSSAGTVYERASQQALAVDNALQIRLSDGVVDIQAGGSATVSTISALGIDSVASGINSKGFYAPGSAVSIIADGAVTLDNTTLEQGLTSTQSVSSKAFVYPGSLEAVSFTAGLGFSPAGANPSTILLYPDPTGTLTLLADGDIAPVVMAQLDSDPTLLPGAFSDYFFNSATGNLTGLQFAFPAVLPNTTDVTLRELHNATITHAGDPNPNRLAAGGDITDVSLSAAKQTRIAAGRDIINMVFLGQNVAASDISRVVAGRDITATTRLDALSTNPQDTLPTVQGDTFVLGGPGALFIEAGRDAGPFLTSAISGGETYAGGIITNGNLWNPWLPAQSADIYTEFGVANGENFQGLISTYLDPVNFANLPGYEFVQTTAPSGAQTADRSQEVYALGLVQWMQSIAGDVISRYDTAAHVAAPPANAPALIQFMQGVEGGATPTLAQALTYLPQVADLKLPLIPWMQLNAPSALTRTYGSLDVTYAQALAAFEALPTLTQREFLISDVYFNELAQTSVPTSPSYKDYSRGYIAVNTLFPASDGYTANNLGGGPAGASTTVQTGNLDLRLATIQTEQGGNISILGPGGEVLAGSVVATSVQAARRNFIGAGLYSGFDLNQSNGDAATISAIPAGYEGVITLKGGSIDSFTDVDFLLNQSRAFTEEGGDIAIWSSNADVNAGQGPRTTADVQPEVVKIDADGYAVVDTNASVSGAGIGAFSADSNDLAPDIFLIAPRGTVDAGAAGVRSAGNVFIAAYAVANAAGISAGGTVVGAGGPAAVNVSAQTNGDSAATAAAQAAQAAASSSGEQSERPVIFVDVLGYLSDVSDTPDDENQKRKKRN